MADAEGIGHAGTRRRWRRCRENSSGQSDLKLHCCRVSPDPSALPSWGKNAREATSSNPSNALAGQLFERGFNLKLRQQSTLD
ncbi:MAG: hypothetical protein E5Y52_00350 [Mesorhizobium sp.]|nr:MAG: hypothetical protein E5Y52_00350 [Mesorhizobium sp.]TIR71617.1 MAG: hypothetical protein E5X24_04730 [Mesorhizobium sp.]